MQAFFQKALSGLWVGLEIVLKLLSSDLLNDAVYFAVGEFCLGLPFETRFGDFYGNNSS